MSKPLGWIIGILGSFVGLAIIGILVIVFTESGSTPGDLVRQSRSWGTGGVPGGGAPADTAYEYDSIGSAGKTAPSFPSPVSQQERLIIRSARMALVVQDVRTAADGIATYAKGVGGFIVSESVVSEEGEVPSAEVSLRVPADQLDSALEHIRAQALRVTSESNSGEDVTEEYTDVKAQLRNLSVSEQKLLAIMQGAKKTEDVLAVFNELERVRGDMERLKGRQQYLENSANLSLITVYLATDEGALPVVEEGSQWRPLVVARAAMSALVSVCKFLANAVIWVVIFLPLWGTILLVVRIWRRRRAEGLRK